MRAAHFALAAPLAAVLLFATVGCSKRLYNAPAPVTSDGLELHLTDLAATNRLALSSGQARHTLGIGGHVRAADGGVGFTTERAIRLHEVRDERGRDLLTGSAATNPNGDDDAFPYYPFVGEGYARDSKRGHSCRVTTQVDGLARLPRSLGLVRGEVHAIRAAERRTMEVAVPTAPADRFLLQELTPGLWFSMDELSLDKGSLAVGFRYWLCNDVAPQFAGRPEIGRRRDINLRFVVGDEPPSVPGYSGHDPSRPPFIEQIRVIGNSGRVLLRTESGTVSLTRPSGMYSELRDRVAVPFGDEPLRAEVTVITAVEPVTLPFELRDVPLDGEGTPAETAPERVPSKSPALRLGRGFEVRPVPEPKKAPPPAPPSGEPEALLYDVDFEPPTHTAGGPPATGAGPLPRRTLTARHMPHATPPDVVPDAPFMTGQALRLTPTAERPVENAEFAITNRDGEEGGIAEPFVAYRVEFDLVIADPGEQGGGFTLFADVSQIRPIRWIWDGTIIMPVTPTGSVHRVVGERETGALQRVSALWDLRAQTVTLDINGRRVDTAPFEAWQVNDFRLSVGHNNNGLGAPIDAFVDNVKIWGLRPGWRTED